jgi:alkylhydroperoxidase family enzyme
MTRTAIPKLPLDTLPAEYQEMGRLSGELVGDTTLVQVFGHSLVAADWYFHDFYEQMFFNRRAGTETPVRLKQLLRLRLSKRHGCALCNRGNEREVKAVGFDDAQIDALFDPAPAPDLFTREELAVIAFADQMALDNSDGRLTPALYADLRASLSDKQIVELAIVSAVLVGAAKMTFVLDIVPREMTCALAPVKGETSAAVWEEAV